MRSRLLVGLREINRHGLLGTKPSRTAKLKTAERAASVWFIVIGAVILASIVLMSLRVMLDAANLPRRGMAFFWIKAAACGHERLNLRACSLR